MYDSAFTPLSPTYAVDSTAPVHVVSANAGINTSYRIRNTTSGVAAYITYATASNPSNTTPTMTSNAPTVGTSQPNTLGIPAATVQYVVLPPNCWFLAAASGTFEVTAGEGR